VKFFHRKQRPPVTDTPEPLKVLEQSLTLADALLVYFETGGSYVSLRGALIQARKNQRVCGFLKDREFIVVHHARFPFIVVTSSLLRFTGSAPAMPDET
jgi:hypothetical protein